MADPADVGAPLGSTLGSNQSLDGLIAAAHEALALEERIASERRAILGFIDERLLPLMVRRHQAAATGGAEAGGDAEVILRRQVDALMAELARLLEGRLVPLLIQAKALRRGTAAGCASLRPRPPAQETMLDLLAKRPMLGSRLVRKLREKGFAQDEIERARKSLAGEGLVARNPKTARWEPRKTGGN